MALRTFQIFLQKSVFIPVYQKTETQNCSFTKTWLHVYQVSLKEHSLFTATEGGGILGFWCTEILSPLVGVGALKVCPPKSLCTEILTPLDSNIGYKYQSTTKLAIQGH